MASIEPLETTPLLQNTSEGLESDDAPGGLHSSRAEAVEQENILSKPSDVERQNVDEHGKTAAQYQGMPEVKKRLKYIVPAVAIGVRN